MKRFLCINLGAAVASILAYDVLLSSNSEIKPLLVTTSCPKIFDSDSLPRIAELLTLRHIRLIGYGDRMPSFPLSGKLKHIHDPFVYIKNTGGEWHLFKEQPNYDGDYLLSCDSEAENSDDFLYASYKNRLIEAEQTFQSIL